MQDPGTRAGAQELYLSYVNAAMPSWKTTPIRILLQRNWMSLFPRPRTECNSFNISMKEVRGALVVDLCELRLKATQGPALSYFAVELWKLLQCALVGLCQPLQPEMPLPVFLTIISSKAELKPLARQFNWHLALFAEQTFNDMWKSGAKPNPRAPSILPTVQTQEASDLGYECDRHLADFVLSTVMASEGQNEYTFGTDKAWVCSLPLQNTTISFPDGTGLPCAPAVDHGEGASKIPTGYANAAAGSRPECPDRNARFGGGGGYFASSRNGRKR